MNKSLLYALFLLFFSGAAAAERTLNTYPEPRQAPGFELPAVDGGKQRLSDYRGRYLLVNFWAIWCAPCRKEMPSMQRAYERLRGERFEMLAIHVGPSLEQARDYGEQLKLEFPILVDADMALASWQVRGLPSTFLIDPQGRIVAEAVGDREWDSPAMLETIERYLSDPATAKDG